MNIDENVLYVEKEQTNSTKSDQDEETDRSSSERSRTERTDNEIKPEVEESSEDSSEKRTYIEIKHETEKPKNEISERKAKRIYIKMDNEIEKPKNVEIDNNEIEKVSNDSPEKKSKRTYIQIKNEIEESSKESSEKNRIKRNYIEIKNETEDSNYDSSEGSRKKSGDIEIKQETEESNNEPNFVGYQLVGDSQFCRFGQQILGLSRVPTPNGNGRIGICVSGQTISELHRRVKEKFYPMGQKIILMIGTNDFLKNSEISTMCQQLTALVQTLKKETTCIILLTLPPVPKLARRPDHWIRLEKYNKHIHSLCDGDSIKVGDISHMYQHPKINKCLMYLFETYFPGRDRRLDMIHLNKKGLEVIRNYILDHF